MGPNEVLDKTILATTPIPLFRLVRLTGVEEGALVTTAGGRWVGVAQEDIDELDVANGRHVRVRTMGISACEAAGPIAIDTDVYATANGRVSGTAGAGRKVGVAVTPAAAAGDHISVMLTPGVG